MSAGNVKDGGSESQRDTQAIKQRRMIRKVTSALLHSLLSLGDSRDEIRIFCHTFGFFKGIHKIAERFSSAQAPTTTDAGVFPEMKLIDFYSGERAHYASARRRNKEMGGYRITIDKLFDEKDDETPNHVQIVGEAGSGKSHILKQFVKEHLEHKSDDEMIFVIDGQKYHKKPKKISLLEFLFPRALSDDLVLSEGLEWMLKSARKITFVIDSLDTFPFALHDTKEIRLGAKDKGTPADFLYNLFAGNLFNGCKIISSSREYGVAKLQGEVRADRIILLTGFSKTSINSVIKSTLENDEDKLVNELEKNPDLQNLCTTPIYLSLLLTIYECLEEGEPLPNTMSEMMIKILDLFIRSKYTDTPTDKTPKHEVFQYLQKLSYQGIEADKTTFEVEDLEKAGLNPETASSLAACAPNQRSAEQDMMEGKSKFFFCHKTIQEALCALYIIQMTIEDFKEFTSALLSPHLAVVRRFMCGILLMDAVYNKASQYKLMKDISDIKEKRKIMLESLTEQMGKSMRKDERLELFVSLHEAGEACQETTEKYKKMNFSSQNLTPFNMHVIGFVINCCPDLRSVELKDCALSDSLLKPSADVLKEREPSDQIAKLDISENWEWSDEAIVNLAAIIKKCRFKSLLMDDCEMSSQHIAKFAEALGSYKMRKVSMNSNNTSYTPPDEMISSMCSLLTNITETLKLIGWELTGTKEEKLSEEIEKVKSEEKDAGFRVMYGKDGEKKITKGRFEDVFNQIAVKMSKMPTFMEFARSDEGLCLPESVITDIGNDYRHVKEQRVQMLNAWKEINGSGATILKIKKLAESFGKPTESDEEN